jgi:cellulose synthase/poly-beta-1,6-N-acetylglucosamine synthase-like glycosyltransferase
MVEFFFWLCLGLIIYCYFGYPVLLIMWAHISPKLIFRGQYQPKVSMVIAAHNEAHVIADKLRNTLALDYPAELFEVLLGSDGSDDNTVKIAESFCDPRVKIFKWKQRRGKISVLNDLIHEASGEVILFSDARQLYFPDAVKRLVSDLSDPKVGCASGGLDILPLPGKNAGEGVGFYRIYEQFLRNLEGQIHSMLGATGAIYAIRKSLYIAPSPDTILDDFEIPMRIVLQGYRAIYEPMAVAYDFPPAYLGEEMERKIRTLAGSYQSLIRLWRLLLPWKSSVALQLFSHKILRLLVPFLMLGAFVLNIPLALHSHFYQGFLAAQVVFYLCGSLGPFIKINRKFERISGVFNTFVVLNYAAFLGLIRFLSKKQQVTWNRTAVKHTSVT